ncbi:hypothetical protein Leryth_010699 [Lithospermum erythrorhizon]|nr:hypothetical protein Leryth_010699 [Lithospermum erythrorhizon]
MENIQSLGGGRGKKVVVIGGGVAGSLIAKSLQFHSDVTLIDPKEYFEIPWASLRGMVEPKFAERSVILHKDYFTNGRLVVSKVINITNSDVETADGQLVAYDYLVISTGHNYQVPKRRNDRLKAYQEEYEKIRAASSILIVGGGPTGVELAGEIAADFSDKKVTLVHQGSRLLEFIGPKASTKALDWLKSKRVDVKLEQSIDLNNIDEGSTTYVTSSRQTVIADCLFVCTGKPVASSWLKETVLGNNLDHKGRLKVDIHMRVKGNKNIFAIGDITDIKENKQGYVAQKHALVAAKNLRLLLNGGGDTKLATYEPQPIKVMVSLGRRDAVAQFTFTTTMGLLPGLIKSKDLFVGKTRKQLGLDPRNVHY